MSKKQKILALVFLLPFLGMFCQFDLLATSGRISGDSICTSGGVKYGSHGDGHWHQATRHRNGWYPQGSSLGYTSPCADGSRGREPSRTSWVQQPKIEVKTASLEKFFFELKKELTANELINLFNVKAIDSEDGDLSHKITVSEQNIAVDNRDESHDIIFKVMNSAGEITEKKVTLHIKKRDKPELSEHDVLTYTRTPTCEEILKKPDLFVIDSDGVQLGLTCDHVQVDESNNRVIIRAADQYGVGDEFFVDYKVLPKEVSVFANSFWTFLVVGGIGLFFYNRYRKKKRLNDLAEE